MKIRRHLRSARASSLSEAERRQELREAEARHEHDHDEAAMPSASPRAAGHGDASSLREAQAARVGVDDID